MKKISAFFALIAALCFTGLSASAENRVNWYEDLQPPSQWLNVQNIDSYQGMGQLIWDIIGRGNTGGFFTNIAVQPNTGLYVQVAPANTNQLASLYQIGVTDVNAYGSGTGQLAPNATQIFHQGLAASATSAIGPLTAPTTAGQSAFDLIECQVSVNDITEQTVNYVSSTNVASTGSAFRDRADQIVCQAKLGTPSTTPVVPTVDTNWIAVGQVTVAYGASTITTGNITTYAAFNGFLPAGSSNQFVDTTTNGQQINATKQANDAFTFHGAPVLFNGNGYSSFTSTPGIGADNQSALGLIFNVATASNGVQFFTNGVTSGAAVTPAGIFVAGSSSYGPTSETLNGLLTFLNGMEMGPGGSNSTYPWIYNTSGDLYVDPAATSNLHLADATTGSVTVGPTSAPWATISNTGVSTSNLVASSLTSGDCLTVNSSHQIISTSGACGLASGTITNVVGTGNITSSVTGGSATVGMINSPTFGTSATAGTLYLGTDNNYPFSRSANAFSISSSGTTPTLEVDGGFIAGSSSYGPLQAIVNGNVTATEFIGSGAGLTTGTVPLAALATSPVTAVTGSGNISVTAGPTPNATITNSPTFTGTVTAGTFSGSGASLTSIPASAIVGGVGSNVTAGSNIVVTGPTSAPVVSVTAAPVFSGSVTASSHIAGNSTLATGGLTNSGQLALTGTSTSDGVVIKNTDADPIALFQAGSTNEAVIGATGGYTDSGLGASAFGATSFAGTASFPATGTATSGTTSYPSQTLTLSGSYYSGSASTYTTTLSEDGSGPGLKISGNNTGGGYNTTTLSGERPSLAFAGTGSGADAVSIIAGDTANFGAGTVNVYDTTAALNLLQISNTGAITNPGVVNTCGTSAGNCEWNTPGSGGLYLNYATGTGGVYIGNGAGSVSGTSFLANGNATIGGSLNLGSYATFATTGTTVAGNFYVSNGVVAAPASVPVQICGDNSCQITSSTSNVSTSVILDANGGISDSIGYGSGLNDLIRINSGVSAGTTNIGASSGPTIAGINSTALYIDNGTSSTLMALSTAGNMGIAGAYFSASERRLKDNILNYTPDEALALADKTNIVTYCYKTELCKPGEIRHVGVIADDTNELIAPKHKSYDLGATAAIDLDAIKALHKQVIELQSEVAVLRGAPAHQPNVLERIHDFVFGS